MQAIIGRQFPGKVIPLIDNAKTSIDIIVFDWRWYPQDPSAPVQLFNQAIVRAVRRGVKVRAVANNDQIISVLNSVGVEAKRFRDSNIVHAKMMIIDNEKVITGSHNYTQNAFQMNLEVSTIIEKVEDITEFLQYFKNIYG